MDEKETIAVGDKVYLRSGSPPLTVMFLVEGYAEATYFDPLHSEFHSILDVHVDCLTKKNVAIVNSWVKP